jgi:hypothetical protein
MSKLIWKEWHEQSWKLGFGCLVLSALALIGLRSRIVSDESMMMTVCFMGIALLPVLSSTGLIPAERAEGSFESLLALPVTPRKILMAKTEMGIVLCAGPMVAAAIVSLLAAGGREMTDTTMIDLYGRSTLAALSLFIWMLALTAHLPSEARAGLVAMGVLILWMLATVGLVQPSVPTWVFAFSPMSFIYGYSGGFAGSPQLAAALTIQPVIAVGLWFWTAKILGAAVEGRS